MKIRKKIFIFLPILLSCMVGFYLVFGFARLFFNEDIKNKDFTIENNTDIARYVEENIFKKSTPTFFWRTYVRLFGYEKMIKAGIYNLSGDSISRVDLLGILLKGGNKKNILKLKIIEGWNNEDLMSYFSSLSIRNDDVVAKSKASNFFDEFGFLKDASIKADLQGYLFPDTYEIFSDATEREIVVKMLENFDVKFNSDMRITLEKDGRSIFEAVTLASIIEKEVRTTTSKKNVAGVFMNRLKIGMPLQSDATVNYITKSGRSRSTLIDLQVDSPYNTYKYPGLPPGPISNPGLDSLMASVYPTHHDYLFFLTTEDGNIYFAKTFEEHVKNKNLYLR